MYVTVDDLFQAVKVKLEEQNPEIRCSLETVWKNNDTKLNSLQARVPGQSSAPVIYLDSYVSGINEGDYSLDDAMEQIVNEYNSHLGTVITPEINSDTAQENLHCRVISKEKNAEILKRGVPYRDIPGTDLVSVMRFRCTIGNETYGSFLVRDYELGIMGYTSDEAFNIATKNTLNEKMTIRSMVEELLDINDMPEELKNEINAEELKPMYVVTNSTGLNGAIQAFVSKERLDVIREKMRTETFYILPSSVHEVLCVPGDMDYQMLTDIVREVNETSVRVDEQLSDKVYFCNEHLELSMPGVMMEDEIQTVSEHISTGIRI